MKAIVKLNVPEFQIGQEVTVFFRDTMTKKGICEAGEIVRCKDCKHYNHEKKWCQHIMSANNGDWFCADGERRK